MSYGKTSLQNRLWSLAYSVHWGGAQDGPGLQWQRPCFLCECLIILCEMVSAWKIDYSIQKNIAPSFASLPFPSSFCPSFVILLWQIHTNTVVVIHPSPLRSPRRRCSKFSETFLPMKEKRSHAMLGRPPQGKGFALGHFLYKWVNQFSNMRCCTEKWQGQRRPKFTWYHDPRVIKHCNRKSPIKNSIHGDFQASCLIPGG